MSKIGKIERARLIKLGLIKRGKTFEEIVRDKYNTLVEKGFWFAAKSFRDEAIVELNLDPATILSK